MALYGGFDVTKHLDELDSPLVSQEGVLTPATRRARCLANLGLTATAAELNSAADVSSRVVVIADADTYAFLVADSGKTHVVEAITGDMAFSMPTLADGLEFTLIHGGIVAEADDWIITASGPWKGGMLFLDEDAGAADGVDTVLPDGTDLIMTVVTPDVGTRVHFVCDGTNWYASATIVSATIPTFT